MTGVPLRKRVVRRVVNDDDDSDLEVLAIVQNSATKRKVSSGKNIAGPRSKVKKLEELSDIPEGVSIKKCSVNLSKVNLNRKKEMSDSLDKIKSEEAESDEAEVQIIKSRTLRNHVKPGTSSSSTITSRSTASYSSDRDSDDFRPIRSKSSSRKQSEVKQQRRKTNGKICEYCELELDDESLVFAKRSKNSLEETALVGNPKFDFMDGEKLVVRLSDFSVYDLNQHLCRFKSELGNDHVYLSGFVRRIDDEASQDGLWIDRIGPIISWWMSGFDGGIENFVSVSTEIADYYLYEPSPIYAPFFESIQIKAFLVKYVVELLQNDQNASLNELLEKFESVAPKRGLPRITYDHIVNNAEFIISQVSSYDSTADSDEYPLLLTPCIRQLSDLSGVNIKSCDDLTDQPEVKVRRRPKPIEEKKKSNELKATTTSLVFSIMQQCSVFNKVIDGEANPRCGECVKCKQPDCGVCLTCIENKKKKKKGCSSRKYCLKKICVATELDDKIDEEDDIDDVQFIKITRTVSPHKLYTTDKTIKWIGNSLELNGKENAYLSAEINGVKFKANDYVCVAAKFPNEKFSIVRIVFMYETFLKQKLFHGHYLRFSKSTLLKQMADESELFMSDLCESIPLNNIKEKCKVEFKPIPSNWRFSGGSDYTTFKKDSSTYYYQKWYDEETARFEDLQIDFHDKENTYKCVACLVKNNKDKRQNFKLDLDLENVNWKGLQLKVGDCVFFTHENMEISSKVMKLCSVPDLDPNIDEDKYPEYYRKRETKQGLFLDAPKPFYIGQISSFNKISKFGKPGSAVTPDDVEIEVEVLYRPEQTHLTIESTRNLDVNLLYWTGALRKVRLSSIAGKCFVVFGGRMFRSGSLDSYFSGGPNRFYFLEGYNKTDESCFKVSKEVEEAFSMEKANLESYPVLKKKLVALDIFAGCGGLSEGFHQSGLCETKYAIENERLAAEAFQLNNPNAIVFNEDCNVLLKLMQEGKTCDDEGKRLPRAGEIDIIIGGPPCQGFSGMNRFNERQYSAFKNSLVVTYLSYVEFLRPKFVILENVRNFASFKKGDVLRCVIRCLIDTGYQVTFGVLQSGNYGVPQTRKRAFIFAAAPGEVLPIFPEPTHVFLSNSSNLSLRIDDVVYRNNLTWLTSAPFRQVTVYDSISDLPPIKNGDQKIKMEYLSQPKTHFQRMIRSSMKEKNKNVLYDHICKEMNPLNVARFSLVPVGPSCDWRDLPNIELVLSDGSKARKLEYEYDDVIKGRSSTGAKRGVCLCAEKSNYKDRHLTQDKTLIPWCLPHTSNRHNNWSGLFGRLHWYGYFGTTITNPEPMGKMGTVVHTEQNRIVSVRECARSQGFPDSYIFTGHVLDKHKQIGNAVPPPLAKAIALEFLKCAK
ncbi:DNA (cytosine-5)-methyltransferase 1 [Chamberlinius hualienensis]